MVTSRLVRLAEHKGYTLLLVLLPQLEQQYVAGTAEGLRVQLLHLSASSCVQREVGLCGVNKAKHNSEQPLHQNAGKTCCSALLASPPTPPALDITTWYWRYHLVALSLKATFPFAYAHQILQPRNMHGTLFDSCLFDSSYTQPHAWLLQAVISYKSLTICWSVRLWSYTWTSDGHGTGAAQGCQHDQFILVDSHRGHS